MERSSGMQNINGGCFSRGCGWIKSLPERSKAKIVECARKIKKLGQDDPRRVNHSVKVGLAITLVSLFYYFEPLYDGFGDFAMWAVMTVVVVFEFSVGATLGRGLNRGLATFLAGALGFGAHRLATLSGEKGEPMLLGLFVFLLATTVTFVRFFPRMKARYDYGLLIFILTFCLISVSGYRDDEVLDMAHKRVSTILIGGLTAVFVCICICPVWAGDDLHNLAATNIEKLGIFLEHFGVEFFRKPGEGESINKASLQGYKSVLNSKNMEESLVNFARWEPGHGQFKFRHPWKHYLKFGSLTRQCAYRVEALNGYLNSDIKTPPEIQGMIQDSCTKMSSELGKALKELALAIKRMTPPSSASSHLVKSKNAAKNLKLLLYSDLCSGINLLEVVPAVTVTSLLFEVISCTEKIAEAIHELASLAQFENVEQEKPKLPEQGEMQQGANMDVHHHVVTIDQPPPVKPQNGSLSSSTTS
ncbi:aluminum-activated malate transporter 2-like [Populus nigra]|uniref:aluminum-activated malate transporter 2-like n=1 Tax=Populus nigra TaxID=3691 RepID=UPI002B26E7EB|nr:aluminum-activated malate transporter 2-like [Populus nigra]